jgi:GDP-mannose 6-dehydrogenase
VADLYGKLDVEPVLTGLRTAEMIKYAWNALNAVKIDFANEMGAVCASVGIAAEPVMEAVCRERCADRSAYLRPGFAFGGSCLGKDLRALLAHARAKEMALPLLEAVVPSNERQLDRTMQALSKDGGGTRLGVFGLAFKAGTDDVRESAAVRLIARLLEAGRQVRVFDPSFELGKIYGSNLEWLRAAIPSIEEVLVRDVRAFLAWPEEILLVHRPSAELLDEILLSGVRVRALYSGNPDRMVDKMRRPAQFV